MRAARAARNAALAGLVALAFIGAIFVVALAAGSHADAGAARPLVTIDDVARALRGRGLAVSPTGRLVPHPRLPVAGEELQVNGERVVVYIFASSEERAAAEPAMQMDLRVMAGSVMDDPLALRWVSARNALLVYETTDRAVAMSVYRAAGDLARDGASA